MDNSHSHNSFSPEMLQNGIVVLNEIVWKCFFECLSFLTPMSHLSLITPMSWSHLGLKTLMYWSRLTLGIIHLVYIPGTTVHVLVSPRSQDFDVSVSSHSWHHTSCIHPWHYSPCLGLTSVSRLMYRSRLTLGIIHLVYIPGTTVHVLVSPRSQDRCIGRVSLLASYILYTSLALQSMLSQFVSITYTLSVSVQALAIAVSPYGWLMT